VKKSTIPGAGRGLFSVNGVKVLPHQVDKGVRLVEYTGERLTEAQFQRRKSSEYVLEVANPFKGFLDGRSTQSSVARYSNACDRPKHRGRCNAKLTKSGWVVATRSIKAGGEIFVAYGPDYWV
jgi:hypothetical protein